MAQRAIMIRLLDQILHSLVWRGGPHAQTIFNFNLRCTAQIWRCSPCSYCSTFHRSVHTSTLYYALKKKDIKKQYEKPHIKKIQTIKLIPDKIIPVYKGMTFMDLARATERSIDDVFEAAMLVDDSLDFEDHHAVVPDVNMAVQINRKLGYKSEIKTISTSKPTKLHCADITRQPPPDPADLVKCPPVVTIMGHVDHGKTTLLDALRKSNVVAQEFGGITQHIGAFSVKLSSGESITFLDTPGHAAFSAMRARGAQVTDIIVLVVAADDGVMQQTVESIQHARQANVPIIVAINKIDKREADLEGTKRMLLAQNIVLEDLGGEVQAVPISALKGTNLDQLQEAIVTQAELMELKADPKGLVEGRVVEAKTDPGRGKLVTALIKRGTLRKGDVLVAGTAWAKVRSMFSDKGKILQEAAPSTPVEIIGWKELPSAGDEILQVESEQVAKSVVEYRSNKDQDVKIEEDALAIEKKREAHETIYQKELRARQAQGFRISRKQGGKKPKEWVPSTEIVLSFVLKGDVDGSVEAIMDVLDTYEDGRCRLDLIHYGIGNITETDVQLAQSFNGIVYGFNVEVPSKIAEMAKNMNVPIQLHKVIYKLFDDMKENLSKKLPILEVQEIVGEAKVLQAFKVTEGKKKVSVAGCRCIKGLLNKKLVFNIVRDGKVIHSGKLASLKHHKNEVESIKVDVECGISFENFQDDFQVGDEIHCSALKETKQEVKWDLGFK
ncbi:hypothetical protein CHS0354_029082 [Potamilus streckersoni]|uniref:Translation initiation factor IF-2, mitochondrial n=1 Tax=Potamilus streckersoni TaxID=2493646 RepID=A0AAE0W310_9BIVA|nr:hypothetical protein CHS0354_029082 [Potamilus streckersoni]